MLSIVQIFSPRIDRHFRHKNLHKFCFKATAIWYMVFYSPFDIVYKLAKFTPIKIVLSIMKECQRVYKVCYGNGFDLTILTIIKINHGVLYATKLYPNAHLIHIMVGTAKGAGSGIIRIFEQVCWKLTKH
jgi:trimeric intracellular cation channel